MNIIAAFDPNFGSPLNLISERSLLNLVIESDRSLPIFKRVATDFMRYKHQICPIGSLFLTELLLSIYKVAFYFQDQEIMC